ncbi:MAG: cell wall hydrolase [Fimbriimonadaceae bacterium]|nr:cell wall hydrolase [Alphaproteobacteria bacterium]
MSIEILYRVPLFKRVCLGVAPYLLASGMMVAAAGSTVSGYSEIRSMTSGFDMPDADPNFISDYSHTNLNWPQGGFRLARAGGTMSGQEFQVASLDVDSITGSLPKPTVLDQSALNFPRVNRLAKQDRKQLPPASSDYGRADYVPDGSGGLNHLYFGQPIDPSIAAFQASLPRGDRPDQSPQPRSAAARQRDLACLAKAVYFEARGESARGQLAVAQVIMNRVAHWFYPNNVCDVVFQNQHRRNKCQFSFACDGRSDRARDRNSWQRAVNIAKQVLSGETVSEEVGTNATHYHANYVRPRWIRDMVKIRKIGIHIFYRVRAWS